MTLIEQRTKDQTTSLLVDAIKHEHFVLYGQPIVPIAPRREAEANIAVFVRYTEEEQKSLPPGGFFEILQHLSLTFVLDRWVLSQVVRSMLNQKVAQGNWNTPRYSLNLSVESLHESDFNGHVRQCFGKYQIPAGKLSFEISEHDAQANAIELKELISDLRSLGCGWTVTAYTADLLTPRELNAIGVDTVKIDGQLIGRITHNAPARSRAKAIHAMCHKLGIHTIAEMVECGETLETLRKIGVDYVQGHAIAAPAPLQAVTNALKTRMIQVPARQAESSDAGRETAASATKSPASRKNGRRHSAPSALEGLPHLSTRIGTLWGHGDFETCVQRLLMDARDGKRHGLPVEAAEELFFLLELAIARRALTVEEITGVPFAETYARCLANSLDPRPFGANTADPWSNPRVRGTIGRSGRAA